MSKNTIRAACLPLHERINQVLDAIASATGQFARFSTIYNRLLECELISEYSARQWCRAAINHGYASIEGGTKEDPVYIITSLGITRLPEAMQVKVEERKDNMGSQVAAILAQSMRPIQAPITGMVGVDCCLSSIPLPRAQAEREYQQRVAELEAARARREAAAKFPKPDGPSLICKERQPPRPSKARATRNNEGSHFNVAIPGPADAARTAKIKGGNSRV